MVLLLPQFPVGSVYMPSMPVQLRVFEPRYLNLMGELMSYENPQFGIPLYPQHVLPGQAPDVKTVGTIINVDDFGMTEEFMGITGTASRRYIVKTWLEPDPYPRAEVVFLPDLTWDDRFESHKLQLELEVRNLLTRASKFGQLQWDSDTELSIDPVESTWQLAGILPLDPVQSHVLLCSETIEVLIDRTLAMCNGANKFLDGLGG